MRVVTWDDGRVSTVASVAVTAPLSGAALRGAYADSLRRLTRGLVQLRDGAVRAGPVALVRFGAPKVTRNAFDWPIEGGLLARGPGGRWRLQASAGRVEASLRGYRPALPRPLTLPAPGSRPGTGPRTSCARRGTQAVSGGRRGIVLHRGRLHRAPPAPTGAGDCGHLPRRVLEHRRANTGWVGDEAAGGRRGRLASHPRPVAPPASTVARLVDRPAPNTRRDGVHGSHNRLKKKGAAEPPLQD